MMDFDDFSGALAEKPLSQAEKAAAVLLSMGKQVAGRLLKYFTQSELQLSSPRRRRCAPFLPTNLPISLTNSRTSSPKARVSWTTPG